MSPKNSHPTYHGRKPVPTRPTNDGLKDSPYRSSSPFKILLGPLVIVSIFAIVFLVMGSVFAKDCSLEPMVPIWLIVLGCFCLLSSGFIFIETRRIEERSLPGADFMESTPTSSKIIGGVIFLFFIAWYIAGNVWVYVAWGEDPDYQHYWFENGCNKSVYMLSFWGMIFLNAFVGIGVIAGIIQGLRSLCSR